MSVRNLSPKQKFFLLLGIVVLMANLSYSLSISKALQARTHYSELAQQIMRAGTLDADLQKWKSLNLSLDRQLGGELDLNGFHESLLNVVGLFCESNKLILSEFSEPFEGEEGGYKVETVILKIEGSYQPLLRLVHHLETRFKGGKISSVAFTKEKNFRKNKEDLFLKLYVQKVRRDENI